MLRSSDDYWERKNNGGVLVPVIGNQCASVLLLDSRKLSNESCQFRLSAAAQIRPSDA